MKVALHKPCKFPFINSSIKLSMISFSISKVWLLFAGKEMLAVVKLFAVKYPIAI
jgi:hypothetical protein